MNHLSRPSGRALRALVAGLLAASCAAVAGESTKNSALTAEDRKLLTSLIHEFLFDPQGAQRVRVKAVQRSVWGKSAQVEREGWLVPGKAGQPARVYFTDGESIPGPPEKELFKLDFVGNCRARYARKPRPDQDDSEQTRSTIWRRLS